MINVFNMDTELLYAPFEDTEGDMPLVDADVRRDIYERLERDSNGVVTRRVSRLIVTQKGAVMGNHYHDFDEVFKGWGLGTLLLKNWHTGGRTFLTLPEGGWAITVPAFCTHTFIFTGDQNPKGLVAELLSYCGQEFKQGVNTHTDRLVVVPPRS